MEGQLVSNEHASGIERVWSLVEAVWKSQGVQYDR